MLRRYNTGYVDSELSLHKITFNILNLRTHITIHVFN